MLSKEEHRQQKSAREYWVYHNLTTFAAGVIFAFSLFQTEFFGKFIAGLGDYGYIGAFFIGIFFASSFTFIPATAALILLSGNLNFMYLAIATGFGAAIGDYFIFRFIRDGLIDDLKRLFGGARSKNIFKMFHSKRFGFLTPVLGAFIIASPLPDELGVGLLGISQISSDKFLILSFILNTIGIAILLGVASLYF
ncbi:MAG: hypothetical protein O2794_01630 [bacterium]|nr:hypothetical protein [bacterium]